MKTQHDTNTRADYYEELGMIHNEIGTSQKLARYLHGKAGHEMARPLFCGVPELDTCRSRTLAELKYPRSDLQFCPHL
jgi:hypothetical protein